VAALSSFYSWASNREEALLKLRRKSPIRLLDQNRPMQTREADGSKSQIPPIQVSHQPQSKLIQRIRDSGRSASFEKGLIVFGQGQKSTGVHLIVEGAAKLSIASSDGKLLILGYVGAGSILGLAENILGIDYEKTAASAEPTKTMFLCRDAFLKSVREDAGTAFEVAEMLSVGFLKLLSELRTMGLSESAPQKLATFVLGFRSSQQKDGMQICLPGASQEDLAGMVGLSRETTSRILSRLKMRQILYWKHSTLVIQDLAALESIAEFNMEVLPIEPYKVAVGAF
jgi:CRP-like cAMP-binding protein